MKLSIIIPVYNEEATIEEVLKRVRNVNLEKEIIVVNDGSTDRTKEILDRLNNQEIKIVQHSYNQGKGAAIKTALRYACGDVVIIQDADLELLPEDYPRLIRPIVHSQAQVVFGSRLLMKQNKIPFLYLLANKFLAFLTNLLYNSALTDIGTAYKVIKRELLESLKLECLGFEWDSEVTVKILRSGHQICEIPVFYNPRTKYEGKKINWFDGIKSIWVILKYRFVKIDKGHMQNE